jgi:hypothetical protein
MAAIMLTTDTSFHVAEDVADCLKGWGASLIVKSGNATSSVKDIGLAHVEAAAVSSSSPLCDIRPIHIRFRKDRTLPRWMTESA